MKKKFEQVTVYRYLLTLTAVGMAAIPIFSCSSRQSTPKPRGYYRIALPEKHAYAPLSLKDYPYTFDVSAYATAAPNTGRGSEPYWLDVSYASYNATIFLSYKNAKNNLDKLIEDAHTLVYRHTIKAEAITEQRFESNDGKTFGYLYEIGGNAATNVQFYVTDSVKNFLRGSLYFNTPPNHDSLAPVIEFITEDIRRLFETIEWK
ncbi:MAG: gliding motility lipoprotein GldD [Prevotellaceae bacterium]|jgi:gliding motility-associated lipoprotein GldD|nr:gliding motility lipoprotein GldD [Prevotellaceae bacterium]